ncbi:hypothetical protein GOP47_0017361 [Adiantum capillus-veneris]|uniref:Auxin-responsive protein n=1 Tax=Adiantum capillus-veneris TaxID=13818 RepID=A0A9D4Z936_ADICA|nr:hypothetical protein GOP47_0017361 [Adiantum capillus-veneris]
MLETSTDDSAPRLKEHDYIGLSEVSSGASAKLIMSSHNNENASQYTDLRLELGLGLGLATGFAKKEAEREPKESESSRQGVLLELSHTSSICGLGSTASKKWMKRGFSETVAATQTLKSPEPDVVMQKQCFAPTWTPSNASVPSWHSGGSTLNNGPLKASPHTSIDSTHNAITDDTPPAKDRVVGWPPVRSYRRQTLAKPAELFVKVNMDGITVGRKVDLNAYNSYESLLRALEEMFQPSTASQAAPGREHDLKHFLLASDSEFVLTYEDKDGDWMLVGDVPWSMFVSTVKRLRITRGSEATGSGFEKSRLHAR